MVYQVNFLNSRTFVVTFLSTWFLVGGLFTTLLAVALSAAITYGVRHTFVTKQLPVDRKEAILITGASTGIGYATVKRLSELGYNVFAGVRKQQDYDKLQQLASNIHPIMLDVTKQSDVDHAHAFIVKALDKDNMRLIGLINNAGYGSSTYLELVPIEKLEAQYQTNVFGQIRVIQRFLPVLRKYTSPQRTARIVNVTSVVSRFVAGGQAPYASSKYAFRAMNDALRQEISADQHIDVVNVEPGLIGTEFSNTAVANRTEMWSKLEKELSESQKDILPHYKAKMEKAAEKRKSSKPQSVDVVVVQMEHAIRDSHPLPELLAGKDANFIPFLEKLPTRAQDYVLSRLM